MLTEIVSQYISVFYKVDCSFQMWLYFNDNSSPFSWL